MFVVTKIMLVAAPANDRETGLFVVDSDMTFVVG